MSKNLKKAKSFRFSDSELELLEALKAKHKSYSAGIIAAARTELGKERLTKAQILALLKERISD